MVAQTIWVVKPQLFPINKFHWVKILENDLFFSYNLYIIDFKIIFVLQYSAAAVWGADIG